jgi:hypothetical protein
MSDHTSTLIVTSQSIVRGRSSQVANLRRRGRVFTRMTIKRIATVAAISALAVTPAAASAAEPPASAPAPAANGIIAILIGQFTPPIGSNKGSLLDATQRPR